MTPEEFKKAILAGIPAELPAPKPYNTNANHAPKRKDILTKKEKQLAIRNALRYFPESWHATLAPEFAEELKNMAAFTCTASCRIIKCMHARLKNIPPNHLRQQPSWL